MLHNMLLSAVTHGVLGGEGELPVFIDMVASAEFPELPHPLILGVQYTL